MNKNEKVDFTEVDNFCVKEGNIVFHVGNLSIFVSPQELYRTAVERHCYYFVTCVQGGILNEQRSSIVNTTVVWELVVDSKPLTFVFEIRAYVYKIQTLLSQLNEYNKRNDNEALPGTEEILEKAKSLSIIYAPALNTRLEDVEIKTMRLDCNFDYNFMELDLRLYANDEKIYEEYNSLSMYSYLGTLSSFGKWLQCIQCHLIYDAKYLWSGENESDVEFSYYRKSLLKSMTHDKNNGVYFNYEECCQITIRTEDKVKSYWFIQQQMVSEIYLKILRSVFVAFPRENTTDFILEWEETPLQFYNHWKSPFIECTVFEDIDIRTYGTYIKEIIIMSCRDKKPLFWLLQYQRGFEKEITFVDNSKVSLAEVKGLDIWKKNYLSKIKDLDNKIIAYEYKQWYGQGKSLASQIRELLPDSVDLWYGGDSWEDLQYIPLKENKPIDDYDNNLLKEAYKIYEQNRHIDNDYIQY